MNKWPIIGIGLVIGTVLIFGKFADNIEFSLAIYNFIRESPVSIFLIFLFAYIGERSYYKYIKKEEVVPS